MVIRVIDRASIPGRGREPQRATQLAAVEQVDVATPHGRVAAWRVGAGPAVLLVHGWRDSARLWDPLMAELSTRGRAFVAFDLPGHGFSEGERCLTAEVPDAVLAVVAALGPVDAAVAHSFASSGTALAVSEGAPVERLVLIAPPSLTERRATPRETPPTRATSAGAASPASWASAPRSETERSTPTPPAWVRHAPAGTSPKGSPTSQPTCSSWRRSTTNALTLLRLEPSQRNCDTVHSSSSPASITGPPRGTPPPSKRSSRSRSRHPDRPIPLTMPGLGH